MGAELPGCTIIGRNNSIGHHAVIGVKCQDMKYKPGDECFLVIGDNNDIREYTSIHRSSKSSDKTAIIILSWGLVILPMTAKWEATIFLQITLF